MNKPDYARVVRTEELKEELARLGEFSKIELAKACEIGISGLHERLRKLEQGKALTDRVLQNMWQGIRTLKGEK